MSEIPKRPAVKKTHIYDSELCRIDWWEHEHAVAVALWEALSWKHKDDGTPICQEHAAEGIDHHPYCHRCETLKRVKESGWTP